MIKSFLKGIADRAGYVIARKTPVPPRTECDDLIDRIRANTMVTKEGLESLYSQALFCETRGVPGAYVECGVWKGGAMGLMALVNLKYGRERRPLHLFDSFQDICEPDERVDGEKALSEIRPWAKEGAPSGRLAPLTGFYDRYGGPGTIEDNRRLLEKALGYDPARIRYHEGWFQDTLPRDAAAVGPIAILRIDGDWYASTKICLDHFFEKVVSGGFVIIDDYAEYEGCRKAVDEFLARRPKPLFLNRASPEIRYLIVP